MTNVRRRLIWGAAAGVIALIGVGLLIGGRLTSDRPVAGERVTVERGTVTASVTATGEAASAADVALQFDAPGVVTRVSVTPGDTVAAGDVLARIDDTLAVQQVAAARSSLAQALANAQTARLSVADAEQALTLARRSAAASNDALATSVTQARESLADAQRRWSEACLTAANPACPNPAAASAILVAESGVTSAQVAYDAAVRTAAANATRYDATIVQARATAAKQQQVTDATCGAAGVTAATCASAELSALNARQAVDNAELSRASGLLADAQAVTNARSAQDQATITRDRTIADLRAAAQDAVRAAQQGLSTALANEATGRAGNASAVATAEDALAQARTAVAGLGAGSAEQGASSSAIAVTAAQAALANAERDLARTRLQAPIAGVVGSVDLVVGQPAPTAAAAVVLVPSGPLQVRADFAESDAAKVRIGARATVTFAALPGVSVAATVVQVQPLPVTTGDALVRYRVTVALDEQPVTLRSGMTATVEVVVEQASDALYIPQAALIDDGSGVTVRRVQDAGTDAERVVEVPVTIGVRGDTGTQITDGLAAGDVLEIPDDADGSGFPEGGVPAERRGPFGEGGD